APRRRRSGRRRPHHRSAGGAHRSRRHARDVGGARARGRAPPLRRRAQGARRRARADRGPGAGGAPSRAFGERVILRERDRLAPRALARPKSGGTTSRHYDVVVLGRSLGCLVAAALLARRELRVLLLGQGERAVGTGLQGRRLARRRVTVPYADNTLWRRVLRELALTQTFRRLTTPLGPSYSVLLPERRLSVFGDAKATSRDVSREF